MEDLATFNTKNNSYPIQMIRNSLNDCINDSRENLVVTMLSNLMLDVAIFLLFHLIY
ncbi:hypothetical protein PIROE2DRAFT_14659 [Piromyces sp. E2]|nr:hypothetical protein PIROE2DRAFT_14659 [Piromyces sp. E2]|eukprot:OUM59722.1 hypothetical protein PIROE2DRAFT_14659 [Piromyces sp. E2]